MRDNQGLEVTSATPKILDAINLLQDIFFKKKEGATDLLPKIADENPQCPLLQLYTAMIYFLSFSTPVIKE